MLWFDGTSTVEPGYIQSAILKGVPLQSIFVSEVDEEVRQFNRSSEDSLRVKESLDPIRKDWNIPKEYKEKDVTKHLQDLFAKSTNELSASDQLIRKKRLDQEIDLFLSYGLEDIIRTLIYVVDTFEANSVVWGVGRGSSVSSYLLYLIGIHDVDPILYELDIHEFIKRRPEDEITTSIRSY